MVPSGALWCGGLALLRSLQPGAVLAGRYAVERVVPTLSRPGEGHPDPVLRAWDAQRDGMPVCIKVDLVPEGAPAEVLARAPRESPLRASAAILARLDHPSLPRLVEIGQHQGHVLLVTSWLELVPLAARAADLSALERRRVCEQLLDAVAHLHARGGVHRDIKPGNLLLAGEGADLTLGLIDFGLAVAVALNTDRAPPPLPPGGTTGWTAPEQRFAAPVDPRSDLYAVGTTLAYALTGQSLFPTGEGAAKAQLFGTPRAEVVAAIPAPLRALILGLVARDPERRYPSAAAAAVELSIAAATGGFFTAERPPPAHPPPGPPSPSLSVADAQALLTGGHPERALAPEADLPSQPEALEVQARAHLACRDWPAARACADAALAQEPRWGGAWLARALACLGSGADADADAEDSLAQFRAARPPDPLPDPWRRWTAEAVSLEIGAGRMPAALEMVAWDPDAAEETADRLRRILRSDHHRREAIASVDGHLGRFKQKSIEGT